MDISPAALVNASTQMQQSQVDQAAQILVLKKAMDNPGRRGIGVATGPAPNHKRHIGNSNQHDGVSAAEFLSPKTCGALRLPSRLTARFLSTPRFAITGAGLRTC